MQTQIYSMQNLPAGKISIVARPRGGDWLMDEIKAIHKADVDVLVSLLTVPETVELGLREEEIICHEQGLIYYSFPITDLSTPNLSNITLNFLTHLNEYRLNEKHIAFHCRQSVGRSGLMAISLLILAGFSPDQACTQMSKARGCKVPETQEQRRWIEKFALYNAQDKLNKP